MTQRDKKNWVYMATIQVIIVPVKYTTRINHTQDIFGLYQLYQLFSISIRKESG